MVTFSECVFCIPLGETHMTVRSTIICFVGAMGLLVNSFVSAEDDWISLFDGKTLNGWTVRGGTATYKVEDGTIVGTTTEGSKNTFLCQGPFDDFVLEFEVELCDKESELGCSVSESRLRTGHTATIKSQTHSREGRGLRISMRNREKRNGNGGKHLG